MIPSNHKWFRNLAVSQIIADALEDMNLGFPEPTVDLDEIRRKYHAEAAEEGGKVAPRGGRRRKGQQKKRSAKAAKAKAARAAAARAAAASTPKARARGAAE